MSEADARRLRRLAEELEEIGMPPGAGDPIFLEEVDYALRPVVFERRTASSGTILRPSAKRLSWWP